MRRTLPLLFTVTLLLAACGSDAASTDSSAPDGSAVMTDGATTDGGGGTEPGVSFEDVGPPPTNPDKPRVDIPSEAPTELEVIVLQPGTGPEAKTGDTVVVDYIGVRSSDGVEFDNSYDRFQPFPVVLGQGSVIKGWDEGLVDAQAGERLQLDIPSDLAYGADSRGDVIGENEALTFVIDVRAVIQSPDPADAPTEPGVPLSEGATDTTTVDLTEGTGPTLEKGQTAVISYVLFRGDNGTQLESSWARKDDDGNIVPGEPVQVPTGDDGFPGFAKGLPGMKVGGRRAIIIPPADGFGDAGNPTLGLPADTDMIIVVDLLGVY